MSFCVNTTDALKKIMLWYHDSKLTFLTFASVLVSYLINLFVNMAAQAKYNLYLYLLWNLVTHLREGVNIICVFL